MTINRDKNIFYLVLAILLLLIVIYVIVIIKGVFFKNVIIEEIIFLLLNVSLIVVVIILLFILYARSRKDFLRDNYITNIIHDCKTPITTINLVCQTLEDVDSDEDIKYYSNIVKIESSKLIVMIENVLNYIRLNNISLECNHIVDAHQVVNDAVCSMRFLVKNLNGAISTNLHSNNYYVKGNYDILFSIVSNIINNAIKYTEQTPKIIVSTKNVGDNIEISIKDNGIGIDESELKNIFDKAYRVSSSTCCGGSGFGLYYVKENVNKLNGNIIVNSSNGNGSEFRITLPIVK